jgi:hypothetical protein
MQYHNEVRGGRKSRITAMLQFERNLVSSLFLPLSTRVVAQQIPESAEVHERMNESLNQSTNE